MARPTSPTINGVAVREFRKLRNLAQNELASLAGISPQYLADIERGARNASTDVATALANRLAVNLAALVPGAVAA